MSTTARVFALAVAAASWAGGAAAEGTCRYDVALGPDLVLEVGVTCRAESGAPGFDPTAAPFAAFVSGFHDDGAGNARYRLDLKAWADESDSIDGAARSGDSVIATAASWLLPPVIDEAMSLEVRKGDAGADAILFAAETDAGTAFHEREALDYAGFAVFGRFTAHGLADHAGVTITTLDGGLDLDRDALDDWVRRGLAVSRALWPGPPSSPLLVAVIPVPVSGGVIFGLSRGGGGAGIAVFLGEHTEPTDLDDDWVLAHELVHVGMPFIPGSPLALDAEASGASQGSIGIEDCLRAVRAAHGGNARQVGLPTVIAICDETFGDRLMTRFLERHARAAAPLDLEDLMVRLGVHTTGAETVLDETAPLAWVRHAIELDGMAP